LAVYALHLLGLQILVKQHDGMHFSDSLMTESEIRTGRQHMSLVISLTITIDFRILLQYVDAILILHNILLHSSKPNSSIHTLWTLLLLTYYLHYHNK